nr:hypothetical protein [Halobacillus sp. Nhm2S1]
MEEWAQKAGLGLDSENITIQYIWNPGGFVNQSYQISDGEKCLHVKFVKKDHIARLKQWAHIHEYLTENYHVPKLLMEIHEEVIPGHPYGLVFEFFEGDTWKGQAWQGEILANASLLWPWVYSKDWPIWEEKVRDLAGKQVVERMRLYFKAKLLDDVIDVLADYVEAENYPEVKERTQQRAKATHLRALELYMARDEMSLYE